MEEKIIIEGKVSKKVSTKWLRIGLLLVLIGLLLFVMNVKSSWRISSALFLEEMIGEPVTVEDYIDTLIDCIFFQDLRLVSLVLSPGVFLSIYGFSLWLSLRNNCITVTNKRVYGITNWNKQVDIPINQISVVSTSSMDGVTIDTYSGRTVFKAIENCFAVHVEITNLLVQNQEVVTPIASQVTQEASASAVEDLKRYKELLDVGVITQEEFDAKKKQLLGL